MEIVKQWIQTAEEKFNIAYYFLDRTPEQMVKSFSKQHLINSMTSWINFMEEIRNRKETA